MLCGTCCVLNSKSISDDHPCQQKAAVVEEREHNSGKTVVECYSSSSLHAAHAPPPPECATPATPDVPNPEPGPGPAPADRQASSVASDSMSMHDAIRSLSLDYSVSQTASANRCSECCRAKLLEAKFILQKLAGLSSTPTIALTEAAEFISQYLGVALVSIVGAVEGVDAHILFGSHGVGSQELERTPVMHGRQWSSAATLDNKPALVCSVRTPQDKAALPLDWQALHEVHGLRSFLAIPITTDKDICGVLAVAKMEPDAFDIETWEPLLGVITVGLLHFMRQDHMRQLALLLTQMDTSPDHMALISRFLHGTQRLLLTSTNIQTSCRLGLLSCDATQAMLFECEPTPSKPPQVPLPRGAAAMANLPADTDIQVTEIPLQNTLLLDSVVKGKARFVSDCALYLQSCMKPAADIFISGTSMVASIVVLPLIHNHTAFGGVYFTLDTPSNFQHMKDLLLGFVSHTVLLLYKHLGEDLADVWLSIQQQKAVPPPATPMDATDSSTDSTTPAPLQGAPSLPSETSSSTVKAVYKSRPPSRTAGIMKVLQNEIRKARAKYEWVEGLQLSEVIGRGGFGLVYRGLYKGSVAAVKVMYARQHERQAMKDALEMAVLTTVTHPNIIQVYDCLMDMVEDASDPNPASPSATPPGTAPSVSALASPQHGASTGPGGRRFNVRFRKLQPGEDSSLATCNIVVMEFCDQGSLRMALKKGTFHRVVEGATAVDLKMVVLVLIEVAQAIQHLHSMKLIHCDIKPENVLLKSDTTKAIGFATKLSDFGLAKMLRENYYIVNRSGSGTVTHLAPELFQVGSKLTAGVDAFSFGIMMWELYTGQRAYSGMGRDVIIDRVYKKKARPVFPVGAPVPYTTLAADCWDNQPSARPNFLQVLTRLQDMLTVFTMYPDPVPVKNVPVMQ